MLREGHRTLCVRHVEQGCFTIDICDGDDEFKHIGLDRSQAHLMLLYLQQHLTVGNQVCTNLDKAIEDELSNGPKDIMK
jgi:hypothetical protein